jgi:hypothetical protein
VSAYSCTKVPNHFSTIPLRCYLSTRSSGTICGLKLIASGPIVWVKTQKGPPLRNPPAAHLREPTPVESGKVEPRMVANLTKYRP